MSVIFKYPPKAWLPHPKAVFQFVILMLVIPNEGDATNMGSVSEKLVRYPTSLVKLEILGDVANQVVNTGSNSDNR